MKSATTDETEHLVVTNTGAGPDANTTLIRGTYTADGDAQGRFLLFEDNAADDKFLIGLNGATVITGSAEGTAALTLTAGDVVVTDGNVLVSDGAVAVAVETVASATNMAIDSSVVTLTGTTTIATITGGVAGQELTIIFTTAIAVTDDDTTTATDAINLVGTATNFTSAAGDVLQLIYTGAHWREISRSVNN